MEDAERLGGRPRRADDGAADAARTRSRRTPARPPTTTPSTCWCARSSASRAASRSSWSASRCSTTARRPPRGSLVGEGRHAADAERRRRDDPAAHRHGARRSRAAGSGRATSCEAGERAVLRAVVGRGARGAGRRRRRRRAGSTPRRAFWRGWLGRARLPDHRWRDPIQRSALAIKGLTYMPTGATVAALTTSLPGDPGRRAQLGLPLHVDARLDVHAAGAALAQPRLGGRRVHAVRRRRRGQPRTARCRSCTGSTGGAT